MREKEYFNRKTKVGLSLYCNPFTCSWGVHFTHLSLCDVQHTAKELILSLSSLEHNTSTRRDAALSPSGSNAVRGLALSRSSYKQLSQDVQRKTLHLSNHHHQFIHTKLRIKMEIKSLQSSDLRR